MLTLRMQKIRDPTRRNYAAIPKEKQMQSLDVVDKDRMLTSHL